MKKSFAFTSALFLLVASFGWAQTVSQDPPKHRQHTRPPYSGPSKSPGRKPNLPLPPKPSGKPEPRPKGTSDQIVVR